MIDEVDAAINLHREMLRQNIGDAEHNRIEIDRLLDRKQQKTINPRQTDLEDALLCLVCNVRAKEHGMINFLEKSLQQAEKLLGFGKG